MINLPPNLDTILYVALDKCCFDTYASPDVMADQAGGSSFQFSSQIEIEECIKASALLQRNLGLSW